MAGNEYAVRCRQSVDGQHTQRGHTDNENIGSNLRVLDTEIPFPVWAAKCSVEGKSIFAHDGKGKEYAVRCRQSVDGQHTQRGHTDNENIVIVPLDRSQVAPREPYGEPGCEEPG